MTMSILSARIRTAPPPGSQRGAVLALVLVLLVALSMMGILSLRGAIASERIAHATRTQALALQAAEIALRHCEAVLLQDRAMAAAARTAPADEPLTRAPPPSPRWSDVAAWDRQAVGAQAVPLALLQADGTHAVFRRAPECLIENTSAPHSPGDIHTVTARGFGPDVPATPLTGAPTGAEAWVQSQIAWPASGAGGPLRSWRQLMVR
jgi:Tfp pilus assembly protein PilX